MDKVIMQYVVPVPPGGGDVVLDLPDDADFIALNREGRKNMLYVVTSWEAGTRKRFFKWAGPDGQFSWVNPRFVGSLVIDGRILFLFEVEEQERSAHAKELKNLR